MSLAKYKQRSIETCTVKNPTRTQLLQRECHARLTSRAKKIVREEFDKRGGCCEFCGLVENFKIYEWHHINDDDPTKIRIGKLVGKSPSVKRLKAELAKCVVLCANCHNKFHQDLLCMLDHRQLHIDGKFGVDVSKIQKVEEPNSLQMLLGLCDE